MYLFIDDSDIEKVEELLLENDIEYSTNIDPLYYTIDNRVKSIIENNVFVNNIEDVNELIEFIYKDFNPLNIDNELLDKMAIYESGRIL